MSGKYLIVILLLLFSAFLTGCALDRPGMETDMEVRILVPQWRPTGSGSRALAPETMALRVELWQSGRLMTQAIAAPELASDGKYYVIFTFSSVPLGAYEMVAYSLDLNRPAGERDIQVARESFVLAADNLVKNLTLQLIPNENIASNVLTLAGAAVSPVVTIPSKQSRFFKLPVPLDGLWHIDLGSFSSDGELVYTLQNDKGNTVPTAPGKQPQSWMASDGALYLSVYNSGLGEKSSVEVYYDLVEGAVTFLDRRPLWTLKAQAENLLAEALSSLGTPGSLPLASATGTEQANLTSALQGAALMLPPNYSVSDGSIKAAETTLSAAKAALESLRIPITIPSSNADLGSITLDSGSLDQIFSAGVLLYTVQVPFSTTTLTVTGTPSDNLATVVVSPAMPMSLAVGANEILLNVTAQDGSTKEYKLAVTRLPIPSSNADLGTLTLNSGTLDQGFSSAVVTYTAQVPNTTTSLNVTGTTSDSLATVAVSPSMPMALAVGVNTITLSVTAQNGTVKVYTLSVTRLPVPSSNADLGTLVLDSGTLDQGFSSAVVTYTAQYSYATTSLNVTGTSVDNTATVVVSPAMPMNLAVGVNAITLSVTAQDGTVKVYTLTVTRAPQPGSGAVIINPVDPSDPSGGLAILVDNATPTFPLSLGQSTSPSLKVELLNAGTLTVQNWILNGVAQGSTATIFTWSPLGFTPGPYTLQVFYKDPSGSLFSQSFNFTVTQ